MTNHNIDVAPPHELRIKRSTNLIVALFLAMFAAIITIAVFVRTEIVAVGTAKLIPQQRVQIIQAEATLPIKAIHVTDGDRVIPGQTLLELDATEMLVEREQVLLQREAKQARLTALNMLIEKIGGVSVATGTSGIAATDLMQRFAEAQQGTPGDMATRNLDAQLALIDAMYTNANQTRSRLQRHATMLADQVDVSEALLAAAEERRAILEQLERRDGLRRSEYLRYQAEIAELHLNHNSLILRIEEAEAAIPTQLGQMEQAFLDLHARYTDEANVLTNELHDLDLKITALDRRSQLQQVSANTKGTVEFMNVFTVGGLAEAGRDLMRIVPDDGPLLLEGVISNADIGLVSVGQRVNVKYTAYPAQHFGIQGGTVQHVSTDAFADATGNWVFRILITPDSKQIAAAETIHDLESGMTADISILTGERRLIAYFISPLVRVFQDSLREP